MAARKKDPAQLRTIGLFSGQTPIEEAEAIAREEASLATQERSDEPRNLVREAEGCAVRWLGLDVFHQGSDVRVALHRNGHAVLMLVNSNAQGPYGTTTVKLSKAQWDKLKSIAKGC